MLNGQRAIVLLLCNHKELEAPALAFWQRRNCEVVLVRNRETKLAGFNWSTQPARAASAIVVEKDGTALAYWRPFLSSRADLRRLPLTIQDARPGL
jgi:hypothetical protein